MDRYQYAKLIEQRLRGEVTRLRNEFYEHTVQSCIIDNLLPEDEVLEMFQAFPDKSTMMLVKLIDRRAHV